jgi:hypothetical protein
MLSEEDQVRWNKIVGLLQMGDSRKLELGHEKYRRSSASTVVYVERVSDSTIVVSWSDSTACLYGDQTWRRCLAKNEGICEISGLPVGIGDAVYRPMPVARSPINASCMMLESVLLAREASGELTSH